MEWNDADCSLEWTKRKEEKRTPKQTRKFKGKFEIQTATQHKAFSFNNISIYPYGSGNGNENKQRQSYAGS